MNFDEMGLHPQVLAAVAQQGYTTATPIQSEAIPLILEGRDVLGCAQTGTGKTAAFALPTLHHLLSDKQPDWQPEKPPKQHNKSKGTKGKGKYNARRPARPIRALVLTPTRELANQVKNSFDTYGDSTHLRQTMIYGGVSQNPQTNKLRAGTDIVIATPGRLLDLMNQGFVKLNDLKILILDEADQMLDMGFITDLKKIVANVPADRQTLMFSATMPGEIRRLAGQWLNDAEMVQSTPDASTPEKIEQSVAFIEKSKKSPALIKFLENVNGERQLVFCRTKRGADRVVQDLKRAKIFAMAIHGDKTQKARQHALEKFSSSRPPVLVATDVAARGLHMPGVSHVINYDLPMTPEIYIHRIGRTARAGAEGESISFCSGEERSYLRRIEKLIKRAVKVAQIPGVEQSAPSKAKHNHKPSGSGAKTRSRRPRRGPMGGQKDGESIASKPFKSRRFGDKNKVRGGQFRRKKRPTTSAQSSSSE